MSLTYFIWNKFLTVVSGHAKPPNALLPLCCVWEVLVQLGTFMERRSSWTTYDVEFDPPMETGGSCLTLNLHENERFLTSICSFRESKGFWQTFVLSRNRKVPDKYLFLHGSRGSWPTWNLLGTKFESSLNWAVPDHLWTFMKSRCSEPLTVNLDSKNLRDR